MTLPITHLDMESTDPAAHRTSDRPAQLFVWGVWLVLLAIALVATASYGRNIPLAEDWLLVGQVTGSESNLLQWLWEQNNEHRIPFPKAVLLALMKVTNGDFRIGMFANAITLAAVAASMILVIRQLRQSRTVVTDAFFPLVLLHLGHWNNIVWSWQITFVLPMAIVFGLFLVLASQPMIATPAVAIFTGLALILLPLGGAPGLLFLPLLALWVSYCAFLHWQGAGKDNGQRWISVFLVASVAIALLLMGVYFVGYSRPTWNPPSPSLAASLQTAAKALALAFGPAASKSWGLSSLAAFGILLPSMGLGIATVLRKQGIERHRAAGLVLFLGIIGLFALAIGHGRAGQVPTVGLPDRYVLFTVPMLCAAYFIWELYGSYKLRRIFQQALFLGMCLVLPLNNMAGIGWGDWYDQGMDAVINDIQAGASAAMIAQEHGQFLVHWWDEARLTSAIEALHEDRIGPFADIQAEVLIGRGAGAVPSARGSIAVSRPN